jgi:hypothetical protein
MQATSLNLENLRKQAKLILRQYRENYYPVCPRIRKSLIRFSKLSDREILSNPFSLSDAQEVIARENRADSWSALKHHIEQIKRAKTPILEEDERKPKPVFSFLALSASLVKPLVVVFPILIGFLDIHFLTFHAKAAAHEGASFPGPSL